MWSEKLENGKYKFTERYKDQMTGKLKKVSVVMNKDNDSVRNKALKALNAKIEKKNAGNEEMSKITLNSLIEAYNEAQSLELRESTCRRNQAQMKAIKRILGGNVLVCKLNASYVRTKFLKTKESGGKLNERLTRFNAMIRWGAQNDKVKDSSWLDKIKRFPDLTEREKVEGKYLEQDELKKLLNSMTENRWKLVTEFLTLTGLRIGEFAALDQKDVDAKELKIYVYKTYDHISKKVNPYTKTKTSKREVHIQPELITVVHAIHTEMMKQRMMFGYADNGYFFTDIDGDRLHYYAYCNYLGENTLKIVGRRLTPHALRHTHTSLLAASGVPLDAISRRLGHSDSDITKRIYLHVTEKMKEKDNLAMDAVNIL